MYLVERLEARRSKPGLGRREEGKEKQGHLHTDSKINKQIRKKTSEQWFSIESNLPPQGQRLETLLVVTLEDVTGSQGRAREAVTEYPTRRHQQPPITKAYPTPHGNSASVKNPAIARNHPSQGRSEQGPPHEPFCPTGVSCDCPPQAYSVSAPAQFPQIWTQTSWHT